MRESFLLRFLYGTIPGRVVLKLLVQPRASKLGGRLLSSRISRLAVPYYIRKFHIDMTDIEVPRGGFCSFNAFFTRKRKHACFDPAYDHLISPCDGYLTIAAIGDGTVFSIKNTAFSLEDLLGDEVLAAKFAGGYAFVFRLTPAEYHRYCYVADGTIVRAKRISGKLHCVRPIALRKIPVFVQNSREYQVIRTEHFGTMVQMEIGALLVGKIKNDRRYLKKGCVQAGEEKGYFEFGGSTVMLLLQKDTVSPNPALYGRADREGERKVRMGEFIAGASPLKSVHPVGKQVVKQIDG